MQWITSTIIYIVVVIIISIMYYKQSKKQQERYFKNIELLEQINNSNAEITMRIQDEFINFKHKYYTEKINGLAPDISGTAKIILTEQNEFKILFGSSLFTPLIKWSIELPIDILDETDQSIIIKYFEEQYDHMNKKHSRDWE